MKRIVVGVIASIIFAFGVYAANVTDAVPVTAMKLQKVKPADTYYTGKVEAINKGVFSFEIAGKLKSIVKTGDYVFAPIVSEDGKVVRKGTVLAQQHTERLEYELKAALMQQEIAKADLFQAQKDFMRNKKLAGKKIVSDKEFIDSKTNLLNAKLNVDKAENDILQAKYEIEVAQLIAPYSGIVTKVFLQPGARAGDGDDAVEVTQMTPLLIKIPFPSDIIDNFKEGTPVKVYPSGDLPCVNAWSTTSIKNDTIYAYVNNTIVPTIKLTPEQTKLKRVYELFPVVHISESPNIVGELGKMKTVLGETAYKNPLAVPRKALHHDDKGNYVLKVSAESYDVKKQYDSLFEFNVKKVYIKPGKIKRDFSLGLSRNVELISLKDSGKLKLNDIIILACDGGIKDGEKVIKETVRWKFLPGDTVKIAIPSLSKEGIYVPAKAVLNQAKGDNYVYIIENGKAKLTHVDIMGRSSGLNMIVGKDIKPGAKIIVLDRENELKELYDGVNVKVVKEEAAPERIKHERVDKLILTEEEIAKTYF